MEFSKQQNGPATIVSIVGSLDALTAPRLIEFLGQAMQDGSPNLVADLSRLDYTSSAGLRVLLSAVKETRQRGGDLRLAAVQDNVNKVLTLSGFTSILQSYPDVSSAVASFNA